MLRDVQQKMADVATVAEENIVGVHVVKSFAQEQAEQDKFERRSEAVFAQSVRANRQRAFYVPVLVVPAAARRRRRCSLVGGQHGRGRLAVGRRTSSRFNLYLAMLVFPLRMLGMWIGEGQRATASGERIFQMIDEPEEIRDAPGGARAARRARAACASRASRSATTRRGRCFDGIDLELAAGPDGRADRPHRLGQDDARLADPALLRRAGRPRDDRRRRRARRDAHARCGARSA